MDQDPGNTLQEAGEILYGTHSDPKRGAMFQMRHAFDQVFAILAPDDEVRNSKFYKKKEGKKNPMRQKTLIAGINHLIKICEELNRAHDRGELDEEKANNAIRAMMSHMIEWADAIGI